MTSADRHHLSTVANGHPCRSEPVSRRIRRSADPAYALLQEVGNVEVVGRRHDAPWLAQRGRTVGIAVVGTVGSRAGCAIEPGSVRGVGVLTVAGCDVVLDGAGS